MKCNQPIMINGIQCACGDCPACRCNETNDYIIRFNATGSYMYKYFITLTYEDATLPYYGLCRDDASLFLSQLRELSPGCKYVLIGEYGGRFCRPHYHINLFTPDPLDNPWSDIEGIWNYGIIDIKDLNDCKEELKRLNYIAKYHSTIVLSQGIYRLKDYPVYYRELDDDTKESAKKRLCERLGMDDLNLSSYPIVKCLDSFRIISKGVGVELLNDKSFQDNIRQNKFFVENNNGKNCSLPVYYSDKLDINSKINRNIALYKYSKSRAPNAIDVLAVELQDYDSANSSMYRVWRDKYQKSVLERKMHRQKEL